MRSFCVSIPPESTPTNVLLFLHGVGEAFIPVGGDDLTKLYSEKPGEVVKKLGVQNVFNHGVPKILSKPGEVLPHDPKAAADSPPFSTLIFKNFVTIFPQTFQREDMADPKKNDGMMDQASAIAKSVAGAKARIAIMGFSRGGFAAVELSARPEVTAIVTMDAVAKGPARPWGDTIAKHKKPVWAFFADYTGIDPDREERITQIHRNLDVLPEVGDFTQAPNQGRCRTLVPTNGSSVERHNRVCNVVSNSASVYEWILSRL
jgi:predicted peptidase